MAQDERTMQTSPTDHSGPSAQPRPAQETTRPTLVDELRAIIRYMEPYTAQSRYAKFVPILRRAVTALENGGAS